MEDEGQRKGDVDDDDDYYFVLRQNRERERSERIMMRSLFAEFRQLAGRAPEPKPQRISIRHPDDGSRA